MQDNVFNPLTYNDPFASDLAKQAYGAQANSQKLIADANSQALSLLGQLVNNNRQNLFTQAENLLDRQVSLTDIKTRERTANRQIAADLGKTAVSAASASADRSAASERQKSDQEFQAKQSEEQFGRQVSQEQLKANNYSALEDQRSANAIKEANARPITSQGQSQTSTESRQAGAWLDSQIGETPEVQTATTVSSNPLGDIEGPNQGTGKGN